MKIQGWDIELEGSWPTRDHISHPANLLFMSTQ